MTNATSTYTPMTDEECDESWAAELDRRRQCHGDEGACDYRNRLIEERLHAEALADEAAKASR
jgi:hypothetical protein